MANRNNKITRRGKAALPYLLIIAVGISAYFLTQLAIPEISNPTQAENKIPKRTNYPQQTETVKHRKAERPITEKSDQEALDEDAIPNQRVIVFSDQAALDAFLARAGNNIQILGRLDALNALRIGFRNSSDYLSHLDGTEETSMIFPVDIPEFESVGAQEGALALGSGLLEWLGIDSDNSLWGKGVKVAILDTGITEHMAFKNAIQHINLVPLPENLAEQNGHGTAVATLIFSDNPYAPGIAPGATPISVRIANDNGNSNSFLIAQGIIAAVDAGAHLINISLGGQGHSTLVDKALAYAAERGSIVVASTGNTGREGVMQPAANPSVIAVGAVDAGNQHMAFSTTGNEISVSAVGHGVNVAYPGDMAAQVSGTSFSAPAITGTLAATMNNGGSNTLSPSQAAALMNQNLNDIGSQGWNPETGAGVPDMWRIQNSGTSGIYDAAVTSIYTEGNQVKVLVQNQGTEPLVNTAVDVNINGNSTQANITTLAVGESRVITIPVRNADNLNIEGKVQLSGHQNDQRPANDSLSTTISTAP